jgi:hypothetical protein
MDAILIRRMEDAGPVDPCRQFELERIQQKWNPVLRPNAL